MRGRLGWLLGIILLMSATPSSAQDSFTLDGVVIQGTTDGGALPTGLALTLSTISTEGEIADLQRTLSADDNTFTFENVAQQSDVRYVVTTTWAGIQQSTIPYLWEELPNPLELTLYDVTDSLSTVVASRGNIRLSFGEADSLGVQMLLEVTYGTVGDRIVYNQADPENPVSMWVELPVGAVGIAPQEAPGSVQRYATFNGRDGLPIPGIVDTQPLIPGLPNVLRASFFVPYDESAIIDLRFPIAITDMAVFLPQDTIELDSDLLDEREQQATTSGITYTLYEQTTPLSANEPFLFTLTGSPAPAESLLAGEDSTGTGAEAFIILFAVIMGCVLIGLMLWFLRTQTNTS